MNSEVNFVQVLGFEVRNSLVMITPALVIDFEVYAGEVVNLKVTRPGRDVSSSFGSLNVSEGSSEKRVGSVRS